MFRVSNMELIMEAREALPIIKSLYRQRFGNYQDYKEKIIAICNLDKNVPIKMSIFGTEVSFEWSLYEILSCLRFVEDEVFRLNACEDEKYRKINKFLLAMEKRGAIAKRNRYEKLICKYS